MYCASGWVRKLTIRWYGSGASLRGFLRELEEFENRGRVEVHICLFNVRG